MDIEWDKIRKIIENKDSIAIAEAKIKVLALMGKQADSLMKKWRFFTRNHCEHVSA